MTPRPIDQVRANEMARKQGASTVAYFISDKWGGYWQCTVNGLPYNFSLVPSHYPRPFIGWTADALMDYEHRLHELDMDTSSERDLICQELSRRNPLPVK